MGKKSTHMCLQFIRNFQDLLLLLLLVAHICSGEEVDMLKSVTTTTTAVHNQVQRGEALSAAHIAVDAISGQSSPSAVLVPQD